MIVLSAALHTSAAQAQWVQTNGPYGGTVNSFTVQGNNIFVGTDAGVFESSDSGSSWQKKNNGLPNTYIFSLTSRGSNIFAGTYQYGVYRSTDNGATWTSASNGLPNSFTVYSLTSNKESIFLPNGSYSYITTNDGNDWRLLDTNLTKFSIPQVALTVDSTTFLAGNWITKTTDNGKTWAVLAIPTIDTVMDIYSLVNIGNTLIAVDATNGFMRSTDFGQTWIIDSAQTVYPANVGCVTTIGQQLFVGAYNGLIYCSSDSSQSWQLASSDFPSVWQFNGLASIGSELLAEVYGVGMFRSFDSGITWSDCNQGFINIEVNALTSVGDTTIIGAALGVYLSTNNGLAWQPTSDEFNYESIQWLLLDSQNLYVGNVAQIYRSTNWGESWNILDTANSIYGINAMIHSGDYLIAGGESGISRSLDGGVTWTNSWGNSSIANLLKFGSTLFASTSLLGSNYSGCAYASKDDGNSWSISFQSEISSNAYCMGHAGTHLFLIEANDSRYEKGYIYISDDTGATWLNVVDTAVPPIGSFITCFASIGDTLFAATDSAGIYLTTDNGDHWINENLGLADSSVLSLAVQGNELLAGTATSGVWRRPLVEMIPSASIANGKQISDTISVYPDPASSRVTVSCPDIVGWAEASLISETGATVWRRTITTNGQPFQLDFAGVANGAYRLEIEAGNLNQTTKIVLQR